MHSSIRRTLAPIAAVALTFGLLTACADDDPAEFDSAAQTGEGDEDSQDEPPEDDEGAGEPDEGEEGAGRDQDPAGADEGEGSARPDEDGNGDEGDGDDGDASSQAGTDSGNTYVRGPDDAVETITYDLPDRDLEVTVGLHTLRVEDEIMLLELSFTPEGGRDSTHGFNNFNMGRALLPALNDRENLKQYTVLGSGGDRWATNSSVSSTQVESGQTVMYYAHYAAPEDDIDTINIMVIEGLVEFADAEIEW